MCVIIGVLDVKLSHNFLKYNKWQEKCLTLPYDTTDTNHPH